MNAFGKALTIIVALISSASALAAAPRTVVGSVGTTGVPNTNTVRGAPWGPNASISVTCYYAADPLSADPSAACAGGGDFDSSNSTTCRDNGATVLKDASDYCFYRKNFGLNGVVDARQCGVVGDGKPKDVILPGGEIHPDDGVVLNTCMTIASEISDSGATLQNTLHIVTTGGGVILSNKTDILIPPNTLLTCGGNSTAAVKNDDYRLANLTNAIVLNPTTASGGPFTVKLANATSTYVGCTEIAGPGPFNQDTGSYPNPYSPVLWYPDCEPDSAPSCVPDVGTAYLRSAILEYSAFNPHPTALYNDSAHCGSSPPYHCGPASASVGIHLTTSEHLTVRNVTVLGFGTCVAGTSKGRVLLDGVHGDCWLGLDLKTQDMPLIRDCTNGHLLAADPFRTPYR